jgi:hypothetical protein
MNFTAVIRASAAALAIAVSCGAASAATLNHVVGPQDNLYFTAWGHPHVGAPGTGVAATSVTDGFNPFNFSGVGSIGVVATGCIVDAGASCTGPEGLAGIFRGLTIYSMIGVWSSTGNTVTAIGSAFDVGASNTLVVPNAPAAYLFLGENDGNFADNVRGQYDVTLTYQTSVVPVPAALPLLLSGFAGLALFGRRRRAG